MAEDLKEAKTSDLMEEAEKLHDLIYNVECYRPEDRARLDSLYAEIERRGISVVEAYTVTFVASVISTS